MAAYEAAGVKQYEFMATLDSRTSAVCGGLDGKVYNTEDAKAGTNYPPLHPNCRSTTVEYDLDEWQDWEAIGQPMPGRMTYEEWYRQQVDAHGPGYVEKERQKMYNQSKDAEQFSRYSERLGADAPADLDTFQEMKYTDPDAWSDLKFFYSYKGRVPEAAKADFDLHKKIKGTGIFGAIRVPPEPINAASLWLNAGHVADHGHSATEAEARSFIENAIFSLKRKHWSGAVFTNYYSAEGAAYVLNADNEIRTAFKRDQFKGAVKGIMEVIENGK